MKLFRFLCIICLLLYNTKSLAFTPPSSFNKIELKYAEYFEIYKSKLTYLIYFKKISVSAGEQCLLIGDINIKLEGCSNNYKFKKPISSFASSSTTHVGFLKEINSLEKLKAFGPKYLLGKNDRSNVQDLGANLDVRLYLKTSPELFLTYHFGDFFFGKSQILKRFQIPILFINDFNEEHPLARAEWIKVFGVLCGKYKESEERFREIENDYWRISDIAKKNSLKNSDIRNAGVIYGRVVGNNFSVVTNKDFYFYIFKDLNIKLVNSDVSLNSSSKIRFLNFESIYYYLTKASIWFNPDPSSFTKDLTINNKFKNFESVKKNNLYTMSLKSSSSYWENISSRPDKILFELYQTIFLDKNSDLLSFFVRFK